MPTSPLSIFSGQAQPLPFMRFNLPDYQAELNDPNMDFYKKWLMSQNQGQGQFILPSYVPGSQGQSPNPYAPVPTNQPITPWNPNPTSNPTPSPAPLPSPTQVGAVAVGGGAPGSNSRGMDSPEMQAYFARRKTIQDLFNQNQADPQRLMQLMQEQGIGAKELHDTMDYSGGQDTDLWLRQNGAKPGQFSDLTVYKPGQIDRFLNNASDLNERGENGLSLKMDRYDLTDPATRARMQETMDRDMRGAKLRQSGNPAWLCNGGLASLASKYNSRVFSR